MAKTLQQMREAMAKEAGWDVARRGKWLIVSKKGFEDKFFLGPNGAIRKGRIKTDSISLTDMKISFKDMLALTAQHIK